MTKTPLLRLENVDVFYGPVQALKEINLCVYPGEIVTILGANGAGKTTTMRTISQLIKPKAGTILFKDHDLKHIPPHDMVAMGLAHSPEGRQVFNVLTVEENLRLGAYRQARVRPEVLDQVYSHFPRLKERRKQLAGTLSGGEQQMLAIGRALMSTPDLLMLDEPSLGIAPILVKGILNQIKAIAASGVTILLVEQNAKAALKLADRAYVLETGRIVLEGPSHELLNNTKIQEAYLGH